MLVLFLVNLVEIVIVISCLVTMVVPVIYANASSLAVSNMVVMPRPMLVRLVAVDAEMMVVVDMSSASSNIPNLILVGPTMIFPPIVNGIEKTLLV